MKNFLVNHVLPCVIGVTCGLLLTWVIVSLERAGRVTGSKEASARFQQEAVVAGHAEYVTGEDGSPKWQWKPLPMVNK